MAAQVVSGFKAEDEPPSDHHPVLAVYEIRGGRWRWRRRSSEERMDKEH